MDTTHQLMQFGLTHGEATLYEALCAQSEPVTGYELAKLTGISRSNAYAGLSSLTDKGGAHTVDGKPQRYRAVPPGEFCRNVTRTLTRAAAELEAALRPPDETDDAYYTVKGHGNIRDKIDSLLEQTAGWVYLSMPRPALDPFLPPLRALCARGCKVVVITDGPLELPGATVHRAREPVGHIRLIRDTAVALTGDWDESPTCSCLYSRKKNLVDLLRDSIKNEIALTQRLEGE